jgi:hypothetical protein
VAIETLIETPLSTKIDCNRSLDPAGTPLSPYASRSIGSREEYAPPKEQVEFPFSLPAKKRCRSCLKEKLLAEYRNYDLEVPSIKSQSLFCDDCFTENQNRLKASLSWRLRHIRKQARDRGIECFLTLEDVSQIAWQTCHYCGDEMKRLSLDRIDSLGGYSIGNVVPCCFWCNSMKNAFSLERFIERCQLIAARFPKL